MSHAAAFLLLLTLELASILTLWLVAALAG